MIATGRVTIGLQDNQVIFSPFPPPPKPTPGLMTERLGQCLMDMGGYGGRVALHCTTPLWVVHARIQFPHLKLFHNSRNSSSNFSLVRAPTSTTPTAMVRPKSAAQSTTHFSLFLFFSFLFFAHQDSRRFTWRAWPATLPLWSTCSRAAPRWCVLANDCYCCLPVTRDTNHTSECGDQPAFLPDWRWRALGIRHPVRRCR